MSTNSRLYKYTASLRIAYLGLLFTAMSNSPNYVYLPNCHKLNSAKIVIFSNIDDWEMYYATIL